MFDYNNLPLQDFEGFSSSQMHQIIYYPFDDSCPIKLNRNIPVNESPIFMIALDLLLLLKENRIKLTKLGNIPTYRWRQSVHAAQQCIQLVVEIEIQVLCLWASYSSIP